MMQRFNLALLPYDGEKFQPLFSSVAQTYFCESYDDYILAERTLAHITLGQFHANSEADACSYFRRWSWEGLLPLMLDRFNCRKGTENHAGKYWVEFLIQKNNQLLALQRECAATLASHHVQNHTPVESYSPHITLARIKKAFSGTLELPFRTTILFRTAMGASTENGVFQRELAVA